MAKAKQKIIECEVIRKGFIIGGEELPIGEPIELTERQVRSFVGKVKPLKEIAKAKADANKSLKGVKALQDEIDLLQNELEEAEEANIELIKQVDDLKEKLAKATKENKK